jgi:hypothetical protein
MCQLMSKRMTWPEPLASVVPECGVEKDDREGRRKNVSQKTIGVSMN